MALCGDSLNSDSLILAPPSYDTVPGDRRTARPPPSSIFSVMPHLLNFRADLRRVGTGVQKSQQTATNFQQFRM